MPTEHSHRTANHLRSIKGLGDTDGIGGWGTENNPGYSPLDFYLGSTDGRGHSKNVQITLPPDIVGALGTMVAKNEIPAYRSIQDFIRDAIVHRLHQVYELGITSDPELDRLKQQLVREGKAEAHRRELEARTTLMRKAEEDMRGAVSARDGVLLARMIEDYRDMADNLREPWKSRLNETVNRYKDQLKDLT